MTTWFDHFHEDLYLFALTTPDPRGLAWHPMFFCLRETAEMLCYPSWISSGEEVLTLEEVQTSPTQVVADPVLTTLESDWVPQVEGEQLNLFTLEELGEFYVGSPYPATVDALVGALMIDLHDPREGSLASAEFNRAVAEGWDPCDLVARVTDRFRVITAAAHLAGVAVLSYFRRLSFEIGASDV